MISRVADNCFWLGRYLERAESTARLLAATRDLAFDAELPSAQCWQPLVIVSGEYPSFLAKRDAGAAGNGEVVQRYMTWDPENMVSVVASVRGARELARTVRDVISLEVWEEINGLYLWLTDGAGEATYEREREDFYRQVRRRTQLCLGIVRSTMLHDEPMRFLWLGTMLERVGQIARILDMHHHTLSGQVEERPHQVLELNLWLALLRACSGFEAFMQRHRGRVSRAAVVSFLVMEAQFPRSLRYCLRSALAIMRQIWPETGSAAAPETAESLRALCAWLDEQEKGLPRANVHALLTKLVDGTAEVAAHAQRHMQGTGAAETRGAAQAQ